MSDNKKKPLLVIQARSTSLRLPDKIFLHLSGFEMWELVYKRLKIKFNDIIFAIPDTPENNLLNSKLNEKKIKVFRGDENDVMMRYIRALEKYDFNEFIRVCADNPYTCFDEIERLVNIYRSNKYDYCYNNAPINNKYPDGFGAEISSLNLLKNIYSNTNASDREHIFNYIKNNHQLFKIKTFDPIDASSHLPKLSFEVNTKKDYNLINKMNIPWNFTMVDIIKRYNENKRSLQN